MKSNKSLERLIERKIQEYETSGAARGMSSEEILNRTSKLKRDRISPEEMHQIGINAETYFREVLKSKDSELFNLYIQLKEGMIKGKEAKKRWEMIERSVDDKSIKKKYIEDRISVNLEERELIYGAIEKITTRSYQERFELLGRDLDEKSAYFILDIESRINHVSHPRLFNERLFSALKNKSCLDFVYMLCLRYRHEDGEFGISSTLEPFSFKDINGSLQRRDGSSKKFQLDTVRDLSFISRDIEGISHKVIIMDTDLNNFLGANHSHRLQVEDYVQSVRNYLGNTPRVIKASEYFDDFGFSESECKNLADSLDNGGTNFFSREEYGVLLEKNYGKVSRTLRWDNKQNEFCTASSIARNILMGKVLSDKSNSDVLGIFNKNASVGSQFNINASNPVLLMALPIYEDNVGSIEYA